MAYEYYLYHPKKAPEGALFVAENGAAAAAKSAELAASDPGWADSPAKAGLNPWGEHAQPAVERMTRAVKDGKLNPIGMAESLSEEQQAKVVADAKALYEKAKAKLDAIREPMADAHNLRDMKDEMTEKELDIAKQKGDHRTARGDVYTQPGDGDEGVDPEPDEGEGAAPEDADADGDGINM